MHLNEFIRRVEALITEHHPEVRISRRKNVLTVSDGTNRSKIHVNDVIWADAVKVNIVDCFNRHNEKVIFVEHYAENLTVYKSRKHLRLKTN